VCNTRRHDTTLPATYSITTCNITTHTSNKKTFSILVVISFDLNSCWLRLCNQHFVFLIKFWVQEIEFLAC